MVGDRDEPQEVSNRRFPSSCGHAGWLALQQTARLLAAARERTVPVFYTTFTLAPDGSNAGVYALKRELLQSGNWALQGSPGAQVSPLVAPTPGDVVLNKHKPSAFFGTGLLEHVRERDIDTLLIAGGSTSNCVRATVFDAASHDLRAMVIEECVFDRIPLSHRVSLLDMDRQFADVIHLEEALTYLAALQAGP
jgi:nicotinamidase-related amidase